MPGPVFLAGDRVSLRPIEEDDLEFLHEHINDPRIWGPIGRSRPLNRAQEREFFEEEVCDGDGVHFLIADGSTALGVVGLVDIEGETGTAELGYWVAPDYHGKRYGSEAVELFVGYAFDQLRLHRLSAKVFAFNEPSIRLLEGLGFIREGVLREAAYIDGEYHDTYWYGLLNAEWGERDATAN